MQSSGIKISMGRSTLRDWGGPLRNQYDSDKWEWPWGKVWKRRSWKFYRRTQYRSKIIGVGWRLENENRY